MYESFYGFAEKPFSLSPDPKYLYLSRAHRDALNHMRYGITQREGFIVVAGEVGVGKTTLSRALLEQLPKTTATALIFNPLVTDEELLEQILEEFGVLSRDGGSATPKSAKDCYDLLNSFLLKAAPTGGAVLIIDEAQTLSLSLLETIRLLSNFETDKEKLLQILLLGQVELLEKLKRPELTQLYQRITIKYRLRPLQPHELDGYVAHRLLVAGAKVPIIFEPEAIKVISRFSQGLPRLVNLACDQALLAGFMQESTTITRRMVERGIESLENSEANSDTASNRKIRRQGADLGRRPDPLWKAVQLALLAVLAIALGIVLSWVWKGG